MQKKSKKPASGSTNERRTRVCLKCRKPFESEWAGERICRKCKSTAAWRNGF